jgi:hypothetical protein
VSERDEARQRREEARRSRRATGDAAEATDDASSESPDESHGGLAQAVKVAAAAAAVGAAAGAARAIAERDGRDAHGENAEASDEEPPEDRVPEDEPEDEVEAPEPEAEAPEREVAEEPSEEPHDEPVRPHEPVAGGTLQQTTEVVGRAREQLAALRGREPESVSSLERTPEGWTVTFEVVELERVPDSTDVLASYEVVLDDDLNVTRYARVRRYSRSQADGGDGA